MLSINIMPHSLSSVGVLHMRTSNPPFIVQASQSNPSLLLVSVSRDQIAIYFLQGVIAFSISARKNIGSGLVPIAKLFSTPLSRLEVLKYLLRLLQCLKNLTPLD